MVLGPEDDSKPFEDSGRVVVRSETLNIFIALRILTDDPQEKEAITQGTSG
ncbi:hypothetical protein ACIQXD_01355 [Streptomyces uncialis]|uniref:hypothetical protein n=1 Tax=Streptomyces uncialis TaxID=1048205 RepID=UPI0037FA350E